MTQRKISSNRIEKASVSLYAETTEIEKQERNEAKEMSKPFSEEMGT